MRQCSAKTLLEKLLLPSTAYPPTKDTKAQGNPFNIPNPFQQKGHSHGKHVCKNKRHLDAQSAGHWHSRHCFVNALVLLLIQGSMECDLFWNPFNANAVSWLLQADLLGLLAGWVLVCCSERYNSIKRTIAKEIRGDWRINLLNLKASKSCRNRGPWSYILGAYLLIMVYHFYN